MTILNYKGSIEYEDGQLVIQLLHIDDFITTICEAESAGDFVRRMRDDDRY